MTTNPHPSRRGMATLVAVVLIAMFAVALTAMSALLATQLRRTKQQAIDAQLRQLLHAGAVTVHTRLTESPTLPESISVQPPLGPNTAGTFAPIRLAFVSEDDVVVATIETKHRDQAATQTLTFALQEDAWQPIKASLAR